MLHPALFKHYTDPLFIFLPFAPYICPLSVYSSNNSDFNGCHLSCHAMSFIFKDSHFMLLSILRFWYFRRLGLIARPSFEKHFLSTANFKPHWWYGQTRGRQEIVWLEKWDCKAGYPAAEKSTHTVQWPPRHQGSPAFASPMLTDPVFGNPKS